MFNDGPCRIRTPSFNNIPIDTNFDYMVCSGAQVATL
jgi:hypothetical protein